MRELTKQREKEITFSIFSMKNAVEDLIPNKENDKCAVCKNGQGDIPMSDDEQNTFWICEKCDSQMEWEYS